MFLRDRLICDCINWLSIFNYWKPNKLNYIYQVHMILVNLLYFNILVKKYITDKHPFKWRVCAFYLQEILCHSGNYKYLHLISCSQPCYLLSSIIHSLYPIDQLTTLVLIADCQLFLFFCRMPSDISLKLNVSTSIMNRIK